VRWSIDFGGDPQDVTLTTSGDATPQGFARMNSELAQDERFQPQMLVLVDHTHLVVNDLTWSDINTISDQFSHHDELPSLTIAMVAPRPLQFGRAWMSAALADATETARVFSTREAALAWLRQVRDARPRETA
jgi:hypothetical protein